MTYFKHLSLTLCATLLSFHAYQANARVQFSTAEHALQGSHVLVHLSANPNDLPVRNPGLHLPNGLSITYSDLITFGDFFGVYHYPISSGKDDNDQRSRFMAVFNTFAANTDAKSIAVVNNIVNIVTDEEAEYTAKIAAGESGPDIYKEIGNKYDARYNGATGGGSGESTWFLHPGNYLLISSEDYDHFNVQSLVAYHIGHTLALEQAATAGQTNSERALEIAYAMDAFASHFLSDRFASGHMRTPRLELAQQIDPSTVGSLLSKFMHDDENLAGLHVHNLRGDHWMAYGDTDYSDANGQRHRELIDETLQASANEIYEAFQTKSATIHDQVSALIPYADEMGNASNIDISPLFYWDSVNHNVMRRKNINNPNDRHWIRNCSAPWCWWGWSTLADLKATHPLSPRDQASLALSPVGVKAVQMGLITDPMVKNFIAKK